MSDELFELCKEVYKRTEWEHENLHRINHSKELIGSKDCPLYNSDYILEKLPGTTLTHYQTGQPNSNPRYGVEHAKTGVELFADSSTKALLKLVIALDDAGELK